MFPGEHQGDGTVRPEKSWVNVQGQRSAGVVVPLRERKRTCHLGRVGPSSCFLWFVVGSQTVSLTPPHQRVPETCSTLYSHVGNHSEECFCKKNSFALAKKTELEYYLPGTVLGTKLLRTHTCGWKIKIVLLLVFWSILYSSLVFLPFSVLGFLTS